MALLFMDGFEVSDPYKYSSSTSYNPADVSTYTRFSSGMAWRPYPNGQSLTRNIVAASKVIVGLNFVLQTAHTGPNPYLSLYGDSGATLHLSLRTNSNGQFDLYRGATLIASSATGLMQFADPQTTNNWQFIEMSATIDDSTGRAIVRRNEVVVIDFTGDTKNGGTNATIDAVKIGSPSASTYSWFDDFYICDGTDSGVSGLPNNDFLGDVRVQTCLPTGAGDSTQLTPSTGSNWDNVNDIPITTSTYNATTTAGQRDSYVLGDLITATYGIMGVQDAYVVQKTDAGASTVKAAIKSAGTVYYDATVSPGTALSGFTAIRETDPATSAIWTKTAVNALEFGMESVS